MQVHNASGKIVVEGNIKSVMHFNELKNIIDKFAKEHQKVVIEIKDSISITSSVIGYLSRLVNVNAITLELYVGNDNLYGLLEDLGLVELFNVRKLA